MHWAFRPSPGECRVMLAQLARVLGRRGLCACLGVPALTLQGWIVKRKPPEASGRRAIWFLWCLAFHPERLGSVEDLITWGRLHARRRSAPASAPEWSEWSI